MGDAWVTHTKEKYIRLVPYTTQNMSVWLSTVRLTILGWDRSYSNRTMYQLSKHMLYL